MRAARRASLIVDRYLVESEVAIHVDPDAGPGARITAFVRGGERSPWLGWPAGGRAGPWHSWHVPSVYRGLCTPTPKRRRGPFGASVAPPPSTGAYVPQPPKRAPAAVANPPLRGPATSNKGARGAVGTVSAFPG